MLPFFATLLALLIVSLVRSDGRMAGTAAILLVNWSLEVASIQITGEQFPWMIFLTVDYLSALAILGIANNRWQAAVIAIYAAQLICHAAYALSPQGAWAQHRYWWSLTYTGWAQLVILGGWIIYALAGGRLGALRGLSSRLGRSLLHKETRQ